jgi:hypothetical protein
MEVTDGFKLGQTLISSNRSLEEPFSVKVPEVTVHHTAQSSSLLSGRQQKILQKVRQFKDFSPEKPFILTSFCKFGRPLEKP